MFLLQRSNPHSRRSREFNQGKRSLILCHQQFLGVYLFKRVSKLLSWLLLQSGIPVKEVLDEVVRAVACSVEMELGDELKAQALQLLRLSGKSLDCLEQIIDDPLTRKDEP